MMNFVLKTRNCVLKTRKFALTMMNFAGGTKNQNSVRLAAVSQRRQ